ncbi:Translation initiation factor eIF-2B subunit alpha [Balamuthia mandrillaris]
MEGSSKDKGKEKGAMRLSREGSIVGLSRGGGGAMSSSDGSHHPSLMAIAARRTSDSFGRADLFRSQEVFFPPGLKKGSVLEQSIGTMTALKDLSWVIRRFEEELRQNPDYPVAVAAITILTEVIKVSKAHTMYEVQLELREAAIQLQKCSTSISLSSGCALFTLFVTRTVENITDFEKCKSRLIERGESFREKALLSRSKIGALADRFMHDGLVVLTHGFSRVVLAVLLRAQSFHKHFTVVVSESRPDAVGTLTARRLQEAGIPVTLTTDNAVAHIMHRINFVLVGAEAVVENGGIVSRIGTYGLSILAKELKKPFYVAAESFKFTRLYPTSQSDLPDSKRVQKPLVPCPGAETLPAEVNVENPMVDYTPPQYITLLFTDLGVLTPSAISDELIKLYY